MAKRWIEYPKRISPKGPAVFPHLNTPDDKYERVEYTTFIDLPDSDAVEMRREHEDLVEGIKARRKDVMDLLTDEHLSQYEKALQQEKEIRPGESPFRVALDRDKKKIPGLVRVKFRAKAYRRDSKTGEERLFPVLLFDAKRNPVKSEIKTGSIIRVAYILMPWFSAKAEYGVKLGLEGVQVFSLRTSQNRDAASLGFEEEEGYVEGDSHDVQEVEDDDGSGPPSYLNEGPSPNHEEIPF